MAEKHTGFEGTGNIDLLTNTKTISALTGTFTNLSGFIGTGTIDLSTNSQDITCENLTADTLLSTAGLTATGTIQGEQLTSTDDITMQGHLLTSGNVGAATDTIFSFLGSTNSGSLTFDESEGHFVLTGEVHTGKIVTGTAYMNEDEIVHYGDATFDTTSNTLVVDGTNHRVGIGTGIPEANLEVKNNMYISDGTTKNQIVSSGAIAYIGTVTNHPLQFQANNAVQMALTTTGLGLNNLAPSYKLDVAGNTRIGTDAVLVGNGNEIWTQTGTNANAGLYINYRGYADLLTQFRDLTICNGKGATIATFDGSTSRLGIGTTTPDSKLQVVGDLRVGGDASNQVRVSTAGLQTYVGSSAGIPSGSCYGNHIAFAVNGGAATVANTWYNISDASMNTTTLLNVTHDGNGKLTCPTAGRYFISYTLCYNNDSVNDHIETGIEQNGSGSALANGQGHTETKFANKEHHLSGSTISDLSANDTLEVAIRSTDGGSIINVQNVNLTCFMIAGPE